MFWKKSAAENNFEIEDVTMMFADMELFAGPSWRVEHNTEIKLLVYKDPFFWRYEV
jgi:hypothetical protein